MQLTESQLRLLETLVSSYSVDQDLSRFHLFKKKAGPAALFLNAKNFLKDKNFVISELASIFNLPVKVYGSRSNVLIAREGFAGIFIIDEEVGGDGIFINEAKGEITCDGSVMLLALVKKACEAGFDLGCLAGIPGTVSGAVVGNSGAGNTGKFIGDFVAKIETYNIIKREVEIFCTNREFFSGRKSLLLDYNVPSTKYLVNRIVLRPDLVGKSKAVGYLKERIEYRKKVNEEGYRFGTAGSFWANRVLPESFKIKNPDVKVRDLIVRAGLNKLNFNGAKYTPTYSFLATEPVTTDGDVAQLLKITVDVLKKDYGIVPHKEVEILSRNGVINLDEYFNLYLKKI